MPTANAHRYLIALGSNVRHPRHGRPQDVLSAALERLGGEGLKIAASAPAIASDPIGPSIRRYANSAVIVETPLDPSALLALLKRIEREFGRRPGGQRWRARVLDLDIVLWSGGPYVDRTLTIPHRLFRERDFVLRPASAIAPQWRDPVSGLTLRQLHARLTRRGPLPR
ncbi:2-amino-4-hydroxy-6-hydroxymethyldihydropteridine diphosphokinase [Altererythrobacter soli]|uniref:2-amino-4-hydroxy-6-hydroxymethyldihydropteridine pyrophosphokinase n=1 Tax=Croceibacterium soli TaxID=1739690 RepID=A0A6I4URX4_9SPHN|nr:2-amino-4-hydroxy-6-hydroxymethyldihydropteridine diphosphokinase [Croceibacterium soli]MXP40514.1 2-amino-4-hydroxy-6-hydroxymethyldihydropteridine diphosphokinase [Croceibacterium soli]